jgi:hypothetical protein
VTFVLRHGRRVRTLQEGVVSGEAPALAGAVVAVPPPPRFLLVAESDRPPPVINGITGVVQCGRRCAPGSGTARVPAC